MSGRVGEVVVVEVVVVVVEVAAEVVEEEEVGDLRNTEEEEQGTHWTAVVVDSDMNSRPSKQSNSTSTVQQHGLSVTWHAALRWSVM